MTEGSDVLFWVENLHPRYFLGQEICHVFFLGLKKIRVFFLSLISERTFCFAFLLRSVDRKNIHSNFFSAICVFRIKLLILRGQHNVHL